MTMKISGSLTSVAGIVLASFFFSCKTPAQTAQDSNQGSTTNKPDAVTAPTKRYPQANPPVIFYTTKKDYSNNVPVNLTADKTAIASYPDIRDVYYKGNLAYPDRLKKGFLLDNRGIDQYCAFLDYTYEEYSKLKETPSAEELMKHVIDKDPILEMYSCSCTKDSTIINAYIEKGDFSVCTKLK
jgi:hypothetical protein